MIADKELLNWQKDWQTQTEPLPELKRKIKRQNLRTLAAAATMAVFLVASTTSALLWHRAFVAGLATGLWSVALCVGSYAWWVRRGAWKPTAQTTRAYVELLYKRAVARARILRFAFYFLLAATALWAAGLAWNWNVVSARGALILLAMVAELFLFRHLRQRQVRAIEKAKALVHETCGQPDISESTERQ